MSTPRDTPDAWAVAASRLPLAFAQVREDPRLDLEIISLLPDHPVIVMIASGGETAIQERLRGAGVQAAAGDSSLRSLIAVQRFRHIDETACGLLEDTRCGKRLMLASGEEIVSSHLSRFRWSDLTAAENLLKHALGRSFERGFPAMFCSMPFAAWDQLKPLLHGLEYQQTSATVYGHQVPDNLEWRIDTSEI